MTLASLENTTLNGDRILAALPGFDIPWDQICEGAQLIHFSEMAEIVYCWRGRRRVSAYNLNGALIDYWQYPSAPGLQVVLNDMRSRSKLSGG